MSELPQEKTMPVLEHVEEFRWVLIRSLAAIVIFTPFTFLGAQSAIDHIVMHCAPQGFSLQYFTLMEPFVTEIKIALIMALVLAFPYIARQFWRFVAPGLYLHERSKIKFLALSSWLLFVGGMTFAYFVIIPIIVRFSLSYQRELVRPLLGLGDFVSIVVMLLLAFGLTFQLPVIIVTMVGLGLIRKSALRKQRPLIIVLIAILSAILTPPDIFSQLAMALPTYLLFEMSLLFSRDRRADIS